MYSFYAGVHNGALIVAGGAALNSDSFDARDTVYVLEPGADAWRLAGRLEKARAGRGAVSNEMGLWIIGGTNGTDYYRDMARIQYVDGEVLIKDASPVQKLMPAGAIRLEAAILGDFIYTFARLKEGEHETALWRVDWRTDSAGWETVTPAPPANVNVEELVVQNGALHAFARDRDAETTEQQLEVFRFEPGEAWERIATHPAGDTLVTATALGLNHFSVWNGSDSTAQAYHTITDTWLALPDLPVKPVEVILDGNEPILLGGQSDGAVYRGTLQERERGFTGLDYIALIVYFSVLVAMGFYFSQRETTTENFFLGGRKLPWWAVGLSIFGTSLSAITYISIPAAAYTGNWVTMLNNMVFVALAPILIIWYLPKLREIPVTTAYEYLEKRFDIFTRLYGSVVFIVFQLGRMSIVLYLPAIALSTATGMDIVFCIVAMGVLATLYTVLGGIEAVIWTDVIQTIVLMFGAVLAIFLVWTNLDGGLQAYQVAWEADKMRTFVWSWDASTGAVWIVILGGFFGAAYPVMADQTMVQRYFTTATTGEAKRALWTHAWLTIPTQLLFFGLGTGLWLFFRQNPELIDPLLRNDTVLPLFVVEMFPPGLKGVLIAGLFAASMSSLDSSMNSLSAVFVNDYYRRFAVAATEKKALLLARWTTLVAGIFATLGARYLVSRPDSPIFEYFLEFLGVMGGGLAAVFALGAFTQRANTAGALVGAAISGVLMFYVRNYTDINFLFFGFVSFGSAFSVGYLVSVITGPSYTESH